VLKLSIIPQTILDKMCLDHMDSASFSLHNASTRINPEIREMLLGHEIGLASCYYRPTEQEMFSEYLKAVNLLTINEENRLKLKLEQTIQIEKSQIESLKADFEKFKNEVLKQRSKR